MRQIGGACGSPSPRGFSIVYRDFRPSAHQALTGQRYRGALRHAPGIDEPDHSVRATANGPRGVTRRLSLVNGTGWIDDRSFDTPVRRDLNFDHYAWRRRDFVDHTDYGVLLARRNDVASSCPRQFDLVGIAAIMFDIRIARLRPIHNNPNYEACPRQHSYSRFPVEFERRRSLIRHAFCIHGSSVYQWW